MEQQNGKMVTLQHTIKEINYSAFKLKLDQTSDTRFLTLSTSVNFAKYILQPTKSFLKYNELLKTQLKGLN